MKNTGKCPHCKASISDVIIESVGANVAGASSYHAVCYVCPHCHCVLSVAIDPVALKADTVSEVVSEVVDKLQD
jgi:thiamine biosynthesis protein ThiC